MSEMKKNETMESCLISDEVIATIACSAALEVDGVASMGTRPDMQRFVQNNGNKSVRVSTFNDEITLDVYVNLYANKKIPEVGLQVQKNVKSEVQSMTGKPISKINVYIAGVSFEDSTAKQVEQEVEE